MAMHMGRIIDGEGARVPSRMGAIAVPATVCKKRPASAGRGCFTYVNYS